MDWSSGPGRWASWSTPPEQPRSVLQGRVTALHAHYGARSARLFDVVVDGRTYQITHDVAA